jgi:hypothetical protein
MPESWSIVNFVENCTVFVYKEIGAKLLSGVILCLLLFISLLSNRICHTIFGKIETFSPLRPSQRYCPYRRKPQY